ncbi:phosphatidylglycerol lysyltransferase domain-containing protein [Tepidibacter hydrothermalis]|uniref:Phosphatidylglycerol lysyltransferase domain-containing protein n=1 Tax=Tepidibacter hydrothermalis TaxID=3036126 RepID=A0ABY8EHB8_9FIRM|nr:phosphatidylglycerol lysyltransferase domain-containing protein [Tepidibacter hydrothermalis]WFD12336.1 phosphatidylglycerol lysyltransferase domain-containing protein [Tepidibacter hydrothermalis]
MFRPIDIEAKIELDEYLNVLNHEACEYSFTTLFMWQNLYKTMYYKGKNFIVIIGEYEDQKFTVIPLAKKENLKDAFEFIVKHFKDNNQKIHLRAATGEFVEFLKENYKGKFDYIEERDYFDYVYLGESLRNLPGRKYQKKRNHINYFLKEYEGRFEYKRLNEEDFDECLNLLEKWTENKEDDESILSEKIAIEKVFKNYDKLDVKVGGIYIDSKLEAFTFGEYLNDNMALIHVEKANAEIRGLYPIINKLFLENEFEDVEFVNREEDLGVAGLRKAKLSYYPHKFVEKYTVLEV